MALDITLNHHERWDGTGYPFQLRGEQIPLCARIVAIADVYDALTTKRVYKDAYTHEEAARIIYDSRGTHFDPDLVDAFANVEEQMRAISYVLVRPSESRLAILNWKGRTSSLQHL
jgi:HD-GYP domain-containing protein (c-di-GMP phosphodiesterase class II)